METLQGDKFLQFWKESKLCDIFFKVGNENYDAHRIVLATKMEDYIISHFRTGSKMNSGGETKNKRVVLYNIPGGHETFESVLKFCYCDPTFHICVGNAAALFYAAHYFGMLDEHNLTSEIEYFLENNNGLEIYAQSVVLEENFNLSNTFSQKCLRRFAQQVTQTTMNTDYLVEVSKLLDQQEFAHCLVAGFQDAEISPEISSKFVVELVLGWESYEWEKNAVQVLIRDLLQPCMLTESEFLAFIEQSEELFLLIEGGILGFVDMFLQSTNGTSTSFDVLEKCILLLTASRKTPVKEGLETVVLNHLALRVSRMKTENGRLEAENSRLSSQINDMETENGRLEAENSTLSSQINGMETEKGRLKAENSGLSSRINGMKQDTEECTRRSHGYEEVIEEW